MKSCSPRYYLLLIAHIILLMCVSPALAGVCSRMPADIDDAHVILEQGLAPETLAMIDAMESEDDMIKFHFGLGTGIRNCWGLWSGSEFQKYLVELGFRHPDDMSGTILDTFWRKRHGKTFDIQDYVAHYAAYWKEAEKAEEEEKVRVEAVKQRIRSMMMGLQLESRDATKIRMPDRVYNSERARQLAPYAGGVFISVRNSAWRTEDDFVTEGYFFTPATGKIHKVLTPEIAETHSVVAIGRTAWFTGVTEGRTILIGLRDNTRFHIPLPQAGPPPSLGFHGDKLLAVYPKAVYQLEESRWELLYSGDILLPKPGPPPELHGNVLYIRDEGKHENNKRLWLLEIGPKPKLVSLDKDVGLVGWHGPRCENSYSYAVAEDGDLWACVGGCITRCSLLRRSENGRYSIAIINNSTVFDNNLFGSEESDQGLTVTAVKILPNGEMVLAGACGLFRLVGDRVIQDFSFTNTRQKIPLKNKDTVYHWNWEPSKLMRLEDGSYLISGAFGGIYLLAKKDEEGWRLQALDEEFGEPLFW